MPLFMHIHSITSVKSGYGEELTLCPQAGQSLAVGGIPGGSCSRVHAGQKSKMKAEELVYEAVPGLTPNWSWPESSGPT